MTKGARGTGRAARVRAATAANGAEPKPEYPERRYDVAGPEAIWAEVLDTFPYQYAGKRIELEMVTEEFTSVCPWSGLPDFGKITIRYVPRDRCIELKSLKLYMHSYRNVGIYYEHLINRILEDLVRCCDPLEMTVEGDFKIRGGFSTRAVARYKAPDAP